MRSLNKFTKTNMDYEDNMDDLPIRRQSVLISSTPTSLNQLSRFIADEQQLNDVQEQNNENEDVRMNENEEERMDPETNLNLKRSKGRPSLLNAANLSVLENFFKENSNPSAINFRELANRTLLKVSYVRNWFNNKRKKKTKNDISEVYSFEMEVQISQPAAKSTRRAQIAAETEAREVAVESTRLAQIAAETEAREVAADSSRLAQIAAESTRRAQIAAETEAREVAAESTRRAHIAEQDEQLN